MPDLFAENSNLKVQHHYYYYIYKLFNPPPGQVVILKLNDGRTVFTAFLTADKKDKPDMQLFAQCLDIIYNYMKDQKLNYFSVFKSDEIINQLPWVDIEHALKTRSENNSMTVTICTVEVIQPPIDERLNIIIDSYDSAIGGHKEISKCYHRIRERYYWPNMYKDIKILY